MTLRTNCEVFMIRGENIANEGDLQVIRQTWSFQTLMSALVLTFTICAPLAETLLLQTWHVVHSELVFCIPWFWNELFEWLPFYHLKTTLAILLWPHWLFSLFSRDGCMWRSYWHSQASLTSTMLCSKSFTSAFFSILMPSFHPVYI